MCLQGEKASSCCLSNELEGQDENHASNPPQCSQCFAVIQGNTRRTMSNPSLARGNNSSSYSRILCSQIRLRKEPEPLLSCCVPSARLLRLSAPPCSLDALLLRSLVPSLLPLKRPCSLSRPKIVILNPKFGLYNIYTRPISGTLPGTRRSASFDEKEHE